MELERLVFSTFPAEANIKRAVGLSPVDGGCMPYASDGDVPQQIDLR